MILLGAEFVGVTQVLVYIGAIVVLFLFGIMLTKGSFGDDDGVAVVPLEWAEDMLAASKGKLRQEEETLKQIAEGKTTAELLGIGEPEIIGE